MDKWLKSLTACRLFQGINSDELTVVLNCLKPKISEYTKNEYITVAGDEFTGVGIVLAGEVAVTKENVVGNRIIMALAGPGEIFGEMAAFEGSRVWPATVVALEPSVVMFLPPEKITGECEHLCPSHRQMIMNILKIISRKALTLNKKLEYLAIKSMRGRISTYLLEQYKHSEKTTFMLPLNRNDLADFLNVTRPSLSRELCRLRDEGVIDFHRESIKIKDMDALRSMVE